MIVIAITGGLLAAAANACSSVLQRAANRDEPDELSMTPGLVLDLVRHPEWLGGIAAVIVGFLLQAVALGSGPLSLVEPLLVLELPLTLLLACRVFGRRLRRREWVAVACMTLGLAALVFCLHPRGDHRSVGASSWVLGIGLTLAVVAMMVAAGLRTHGFARAALYGIATGTSFGLTAVLVAVMSTAATHGIANIFTTWQTYGLIVTGLLGMFLLQNALQAGSLLATQPGFTLADPLVAMTWGVIVFGENVRSGLWLIGALGGGLLIMGATFEMARSPVLREARDPASGSRRPAPTHG